MASRWRGQQDGGGGGGGGGGDTEAEPMNLPGLSAAREAHRCEKFGIVHEMCGKSSFGTPAHHGRGTAARERRSSCRRAISEDDGPCKREEIRRKLFNLSGHLFEGSITISITISFYRFLYEFTLPTCDLQGLLADFDPHGGKARDNSAVKDFYDMLSGSTGRSWHPHLGTASTRTHADHPTTHSAVPSSKVAQEATETGRQQPRAPRPRSA